MLRAIAESGSSRETWFFYGVRNRREEIFREQLERIAHEHENVRLRICYSRPIEGEELQGRDYHIHGRVTAELLKQELPSNNYDFYLCGPPAMMHSLPDEIEAWGVSESRIHLETFGPSSRRKKKAAPEAAQGEQATGPPIRFRKSDITVHWDPSRDSLWEVAEEAGVHIEAGCFEGNCGTCLATVVSGDVEYDKEPGFECEEGTCLTCCSRPKGPMELDV
jgi:ferredoxin-NADP reductase